MTDIASSSPESKSLLGADKPSPIRGGGAASDTPSEPKAATKQKSGEVVSDDSKNPIRAVLYQCRRTFYFAIFVTVIVNLLTITPMLYMWNVMDRAVSARSSVTLVSLTILVVSIYVFWASIEWMRGRLLTRLSLRIDWDLSSDVFDASFRRHVGRKNVNVHQLLGDLTTIREFMTGRGLITLIDAPFAIVFIVIGGLIHPLLAVFAVASTALMLVLAFFTEKISSPSLKEANDSLAEAARVASLSLRHAETTMALGMMPAVRNRWYRHHHKHLQHQVNATGASGTMRGISRFISKSMPSLQMCLGAVLAIQGLITAGMMMAASMLISQAVSPLHKLLTGWSGIVEARQAYERLNELLASDLKRQSQMELPPVQGHMTVTKTSAVPQGSNKAVLFDIDFKIKPGQVVAIVGPSAAGKTCLARLLIGVWKPARGSVRLDGVEISDWDHDEFGPQIGYVPQEIELFEGTVAENIARLGEVDPEKVVMATKLIGMHDAILAFPNGYDTQLGDTGFALSGGQRQRLAICRAIYGIPKYIVMDEPNANLDEVGESALVNAIAYLKKQGCSVIITTHRPRLVSVADNLLVLRNGAQVGFGPTDEMINAVRNLQVVQKTPPKSSPEDVVIKEATNDKPISAPSSPSEASASKPSSAPGESGSV
jgi:PrtD family type I secretion system ABC transporter